MGYANLKEDMEPRYAGMLAMVTMQILGVTGDLQRARDGVIVGEYAAERVRCEAAIERALDELAHCGDGADEDANEHALGWAWHEVDQAYIRLAQVVAREALARRRVELAAQKRTHKRSA